MKLNFMNSLIELVDTVKTHKALNNSFFQHWMSKKLSIEQLAIFARNYWEVTFRFPEALAILIMNIDDISARTEYTKTLFSEMGNGNLKMVHSILFERFCCDLASHMDKSHYLSIENLRKNSPLLPSTVNLISGQKKLYSEIPTTAAGAQLALEWQAYTMIRQLYDGARNYLDLWPTQDSFHESCEFFYIHIGSAEKEHKIEALSAANRIANCNKSLQELQYGFSEHLNLLANFWDDIFNNIEKINIFNSISGKIYIP